MKIAEAYVEIRAKDAGAKADAKKIVDDIGKSKPKPIEVDADTKPARNELDKLDSTSKAKGASIAKNLATLFTAGIFVDQVGKAITAASNLEQAAGGTKAVFQESSGVIDAWAENSAEKFGLSERAFREATSQIGAQLKGYGLAIDEAAEKSVELTGLGGDLAATFGGTVADAVGALGATLRGEFDPAERYGIALSAAKVEAKALELGLVGLDGKMTASGKVQATLALITEQTADAQGQFAREAETAGGQTERLKAKFEDMQAEIGSNLLPVFSRVVEMLSTTAEFFGSLPDPVQTAIVAMAGIAIVAGPIKNVISGFNGITSAIKRVGPQAIATGGIIGAATGIYLLYNQRKAEAEQTTREFTEALKAEQAGQTEASTAAIASKLATEDNAKALDALGLSVQDAARYIRGENVPAIEAMIDRYKEAGAFFKTPWADDQVDVLRDLSEGSDVSEASIAGLIKTLNTSRESFGSAKVNVETLTEVNEALGLSGEAAATGVGAAGDAASEGVAMWEKLTTETTGASDGLEGVGDAAAKARTPLREAGQTAQELAERQLAGLEDAADDAAEAADRLAGALDDVFGDAVDLQDAADQLRDNVLELTGAMKDNGKTLDVNTEKGRANREQVRQNVSGIQDYIQKLAESGATSEQVEREYSMLRDQLVQQLRQFGLTEEAANDYVNQLGLTPDSVTTSVNLANVEAAKARVREHIEDVGAIPASKMTAINAAIDSGDVARVEAILRDLARDRVATVRIQSTGGATGNSVGAPRPVAEGGYFRGGSVSRDIFTLAEIPGRRGDEVVLPLGNRSRLSQLVNMPEVKDRVAAALERERGGSGVVAVQGGGGIHIQSVTVAEPQDFRRELQRIEFEQRSIPQPVSVGPA